MENKIKTLLAIIIIILITIDTAITYENHKLTCVLKYQIENNTIKHQQDSIKWVQLNNRFENIKFK